MNDLSRIQKVVSWILQVIAALILARAAYGKFIGAEMSLFIFEQLSMGTSGRFTIGLIEAFSALMLLTPNVPQIGALLGFGTMCGALLAHTTVLGIDTNGDGGMMVVMMCLVILTTAAIMFIRRRHLPLIGNLQDDEI
jgi:hypothetical protein